MTEKNRLAAWRTVFGAGDNISVSQRDRGEVHRLTTRMVSLWCQVPNITLKNIPRDLHRSLKSRAKAHHRSLNKEVIATLQATAARVPEPDVEKLIAEAREMRSKFKRPVTLKEIQAWKVEGRRR